MALTHDARRALAERVHRTVEGRGIPRHVVDDAVARVAEALDRQTAARSPGSPVSGTDANIAAAPIVAVFTAASAPDLGSRVRLALQAEGITPMGIGTGMAGRHTVATVRLADEARGAAERVATRLSVSVSFVPDSSSPASSK